MCVIVNTCDRRFIRFNHSLGQPNNRPNSSAGPNIARPSSVDDGYRPTQSGDRIRPNNQSTDETESQRKDRFFKNIFSVLVDDRHPSDVYGPSANNRPIGSPDNINAGGNGGRQPSAYDTTSGDNNGSQQKQPNIQNRPTGGGSLPTHPYTGTSHDSRPTTAGFDERQTNGRYPDDTGSRNLVSTYPRAPDSTTSDVYNAIRNAFKLPPGLCLVRCDTLRSDQQSLTPQQAHEAFISAGISPSYPSIDARSQDTSQPGTSRLPQNQLSQYPIGSQTHEIPSGSQLSGVTLAGNGQISYVGDPNLISNRPAGGISRQQGGDDGGYRYQTPKDRLPSNIGGQPIGKTQG